MKDEQLSDFKPFIKKTKENPTENRRVMLYTRVSSKAQFDDNNSLQFQLDEMRKFCNDRGYQVQEVFGQTYESAKGDFTRTEFVKLLEAATKKKSKPFGIVVLQINRFSRSGAHSIGLLSDLVETHKVHLIEASSGIDTTTQRGYVDIQQKLVESRRDNLLRQETITPRMKAYLKKGKWFGKAPLGYDHYGPRVSKGEFLSKEQVIKVNNDGVILREAFQKKITGDYSDAQILAFLNSRGLVIAKQRLSNIWRNPFYCGISINKLNDEPVTGQWERLISIQDFWRLQDVLNKNTSGYKHKKQDDYKPLNHFLKCNRCGNRLVGYFNKKKNLPYYRCNYCKTVSLNGITSKYSVGANERFTNLLKSFEVNPIFTEMVRLQMTKIYSHYNGNEKKRESEIVQQIENFEKKMDELDIRLGMDEIPRVSYDKTKSKLEGDIINLKAELNELAPTLSNSEIIIRKSVESLQNISVLWGSIPLDDKQRLQETLFPDGVYFDKEKPDYLTKNINSFLLISRSVSDGCVDKKSGTNPDSPDLSHLVAGTGIPTCQKMISKTN